MGKTILLIMVGFSTSFGLLIGSKSRRHNDSVDRVVHQVASYSANNASASGAYMALNRLFQNSTWRTGYNNLKLAGDELTVTIEDQTVDPSLGDRRIRIVSDGHNANVTDLTKVIVFDGSIEDFAIWAKDSVIEASTKDEFGNPDTTLLVENAPFMPEIDYDGLVAQAAAQLHVKFGNFIPANGYPNNSFYYFGTTPNVTHVQGNLTISGGRTVYGIFVVEGNVELQGSGRLEGILFLPNSSSTVAYGGGDPNESSVSGGILSYGTVDGTGNHISVQLNPTYLQAFVNNYAPENPPIRVLSWE